MITHVAEMSSALQTLARLTKPDVMFSNVKIRSDVAVLASNSYQCMTFGNPIQHLIHDQFSL